METYLLIQNCRHSVLRNGSQELDMMEMEEGVYVEEENSFGKYLKRG